MSDQLKKLGIKIGNQETIVTNVTKSFSIGSYDPSLQIVRKGCDVSPREVMEAQLVKGFAVQYKEPKMVRVSPHADELSDDEEKEVKKQRAREEKADKEFQKERYDNPAKGSHGEEFHDDAEKIDYSISEVDREFDRESRPAKSRQDDWSKDYVGDDKGEKKYTYVFAKSKIFDVIDDLIKSKPSRSMEAPDLKKKGALVNWAKEEEAEMDHKKKAMNCSYTVKAEDKPKGISKKMFESIKNLHENSDGVVEKKNDAKTTKKADAMLVAKPTASLPKPAKDPLQLKQERKQKKEAGIKRSDLDDICDIIKAAPKGVDKEKHESCVRQVKEQGKPIGSAYAICTDALKKKGFVKSSGAGGVIFDFGPLTGNPIADNATALLNRHADGVQASNAAYQRDAYNEAIENFVKKGEQEYMQTTTPFGNVDKGWADQMNKPMDQQVAEAFKKGLLEEKGGPAVINKHNESELNVGGSMVKATSETDAALIEMMKAQGMDLSGLNMGDVIDATAGGAIKVIAGME